MTRQKMMHDGHRRVLRGIEGANHIWGDHRQLTGHDHAQTEKIAPVTRDQAVSVSRLLPNATKAALTPEVKPKKGRGVICRDCGTQGANVDDETKLCIDRPGCAKRAKDWA